ncbi:AAA family ATPase [filamentous cyanobacterium LEGE 11480]|uniref:AAA family ATPase n=1 Tax=Romeriopsis navalis LEGE 11480 TaxID=2777977 RepID=A0A928Z4H5_9CYAN|nr:AAA family ATPase [Romeriopsis navalis]MBE9030245.1 AAA family ATPase [Romeriopsis navalis LEGE 11480]
MMNANQALTWIEAVVFEEMGVQFNELQQNIFTLGWDGATYETIAQQLDYEESYVRDVGSQLFKLLKPVFGAKISKSTFKLIVQKRSENRTITDRPTTVERNFPLPVSAPATLYPGRSNFLGRHGDLASLQQNLVNHPMVLIHGEGGLGKTTLARKYLEMHDFRILSIWMPAESQAMITPVEVIVEEWLQVEFEFAPGRNFGINLDRLRRCFQQSTTKIGILIDNLEAALDGHGHLAPAHRGYLELLRFLADPALSVVTLITSREQLKEGSVTPINYRLPGLSQAIWQSYFQAHHIAISEATLQEIWQACGGNPKAMEILKGTAISEFEGDLEAYWQSCDRNLLINGAVQHLVRSQFDAIAQTNPAAYQLLCRLGAYRYQNVPSISALGVKAMLWDIDESQQLETIQSLRGRSLLEARRDQKFWLHPMIQTEALQRLRQAHDWQETHCQAGQFWLREIACINTVDDALQILEAYHHYVEIKDYEQACEVLITPKPNRWNSNIEVGWLFYRFSLLQQMTTAITRIIDHIPIDSRAGRLYNLLGYISRLCGEPQQARNHHKTALDIAQSQRTHHHEPPHQLALQRLEISARFNLGLCHRDLWEIHKAINDFEQVQKIAQAIDATDYVIYANCGLAYLYSCTNNRDQAVAYINQIPVLDLQPEITAWGEGCSMLYLASTYRNIGEIEAATELYQDTIRFAESHQFVHIVANACQGMAQVHRMQQRYDQAIAQHNTAIDRLQQITAKCDLAEAYIQRGITHQATKNLTQRQADFAEATKLLKEIDSPHRLAWLASITQEFAAIPTQAQY